MKVTYCICLLVAALFFSVLFSPLSLYFLSDDFDSMYMAQTWSGVIHSYRPGSDFLLHTDHLIWNYNAGGYHITNYLLHFLTTFMLFFTTKQLLARHYAATEAGKYAFATSLIFLFYPFHSECIFWLVGRSSLLAALFALASIYAFLKKETHYGWYAASLASLVLGLFSYESIWTLPVMVIVLSLVYDKALGWKKKALYLGGYWLTFFAYLLARFYLTTTFIGSPYGTQKIVTLDIVLLLRNGASLLSRSFVPPMQSATHFVLAVAAMAVVLSVLILAIRKKISPPMVVMAAAYLLSLLPVISLGIDTHDTESERFLYLPSLFLAMLFSLAFFILVKSKTNIAIGLFIAAEIFFLRMSYRNFELASAVTKTTVQALQNLPPTSALYCMDLPGQYGGGFIFRNGIASAARLFAPGVQKVVVASERNMQQVAIPYPIQHYPASRLPAASTFFNKPIDGAAYFYWTDTLLQLYR